MGLHERATAWLDAAIDKLDSPPDRQIVSEGDIARDCEQVAVRLNRVFAGLPGQEGGLFRASGQHILRTFSAEFFVEVTRCAAPGENGGLIPTAEAIIASAEVHMDDLDALLSITTSDLGSDCAGFVVVSGLLVGPEGGFVTAQLIAQEQLQ